jgi:hypothetical protein
LCAIRSAEFIERRVAAAADLAVAFVGVSRDDVLLALFQTRENLGRYRERSTYMRTLLVTPWRLVESLRSGWHTNSGGAAAAHALGNR